VKGFLVNDANPRRHYAEGGPDDETDPDAQGHYYQQQQYGYDEYGRPLAPQRPPAPQQQVYADPYYTGPQQPQPPAQEQPAQTYAGQQPGWIPQQPYYEQPARPQGYGAGGRQPGYDTGHQQSAYGTGQPAAPQYDTGQPTAYGTGRTPAYGAGRPAPQAYETGPQPVYDTGQHAVYDTGRTPVHGTGQMPVYGTGQMPAYDTGQQPVYETGQTPVQETGQQQAVAEAGPPAPGYQTEQFAFVDEESDDSDEVIDWLKFSESRTERREEAKRRSHNRRVWLVMVLVLAMVGGVGYLWRAGRIPGFGKTDATASTSTGGGQKRDVIVVHLVPVNGGPSATVLLVDNATKGRGTTVLIPNSLVLTGDDGASTTLDKSVGDGVGPTRDALNTLLGTDIRGSWRLDSPYLELLVDSLGDVLVDTDTTVMGTGKDKGKTLVPQGKKQDLNGQAAVVYATYKGPRESQIDQLKRFGQVMQAVLKKMPSAAPDATRSVQALSQILDPSLTDKQLGASLGQLAELAKTGAYDTATLPVLKDGALSERATESVVKEVLGGSVKQQQGAAVQARVQIRDATGRERAGALAQAAIVNGGTYIYVPGGRQSGPQDVSQVLYADPARLAAAKDVAATLGLPAGSVKKGKVPSNADIAVVLGRDYKVPAAD
jgi:anionic cell wall polymer biosynthesis LytR-Cps2A-Psr (LCP) family protein